VTQAPAREQLVILIAGQDGDGLEEAPGFIVYGLGAPRSIVREPPGRLLKVIRIEKTSRYYGENWEVIRWDVPMWYWPSGAEWRETLSMFFDAMISAGARVSWVGSETSPFSDPPTLFDPQYMSGGVFAWRTADGRVGGQLDPDRPLVPASVDDLLALREYAQGLADVD
jgi:hypothetical protein